MRANAVLVEACDSIYPVNLVVFVIFNFLNPEPGLQFMF
jgi:hypothetical protein